MKLPGRTVHVRTPDRRPAEAVQATQVFQSLTATSGDDGTPARAQRAKTAAQAQLLASVAVAAAPATQVRRPGRATIRTAFQVVIALAAMLPLLAEASGVDETLPAVGGVLAIAAALTRVMALPAVEQFLQRFLPWLAAAPSVPTGRTS